MMNHLRANQATESTTLESTEATITIVNEMISSSSEQSSICGPEQANEAQESAVQEEMMTIVDAAVSNNESESVMAANLVANDNYAENIDDEQKQQQQQTSVEKLPIELQQQQQQPDQKLSDEQRRFDDEKCNEKERKSGLKERLNNVKFNCCLRLNLRAMCQKQFKENLLLFVTVLAVIVGLLAGFVIRENFTLKPPQKAYFGFPGELFLRMLKFLILPLMSSSLISGIAGLSKSKSSQIASRAFAYYMATTFLAALLGLILVISISPGTRVNVDRQKLTRNETINGRKIDPIDTILDLFR